MRDEVSPLGRHGERGQDGALRFATTRWSVVLRAQGESAAAEKALETLCRTYWWPLYGFVRRQGHSPEQAQDLTQDFFALLLERKDFDKVRREKGRLRSYLLAALKNFLAQSHRRAKAAKRGEGRPMVPLGELMARERVAAEPADTLSADRIYERRWALTLLEQGLRRLEQEYARAGNKVLFDRLEQMLAHDPDSASHAQVAHELNMTESAVKQAFYRLRMRYRMLLRDEIAHTVATPEDIDDELQHFIAALQT